LWAKGLNAQDIHKEMFPVYGGKCSSREALHKWVDKHGKRFADDEQVQKEVRKCWDNNQKISMLLVSTHWESDGTSVLMLVEDMLRNRCSSQVRISYVLRFISICDLFIDSPS
jgi:hypothetical protein